MSKINGEAIFILTDRLLEACVGDEDLARKVLEDAIIRRRKFVKEVVLMTKQLFLGKTEPAPKVAGAVSAAIHAPYQKVLHIIQEEFDVVRGVGVNVL
jgi:hypothetical protein